MRVMPNNPRMRNPPALPVLLTSAEVRAWLRVSKRAFEQMVSNGRLPPFVRVGHQRRWQQEVVLDWLRSQGQLRPQYVAPQQTRSVQTDKREGNER